MNTEWITIGQIRKPHGLRGNLRAEALSDVPERFEGLSQVWLELSDGFREARAIDKCTIERRGLLIKFEGIDTPETANRLCGAYIQVPFKDTAPLPVGQFYVFALVGGQVVTENGRDVGQVRDILTMPANDVMVIDGPRGEILIPVIEEVVINIDADERRVVIRPMPGLLP